MPVQIARQEPSLDAPGGASVIPQHDEISESRCGAGLYERPSIKQPLKTDM